MAIKLKEIKPGMVIHCKTFEEAKMLARNSSLGEQFKSKDLSWYVHKDETCYCYHSNHVWTYSYYKFYQSCFTHNMFLEFVDLIIEDEEEESERMDISVEKIEESLRVIREVCESHEECKICPLRTHGGSDCQLETRPDCWELKSDENVDNRLFK